MATFFESVGPGITAIDTDYVRPKMDASHLIVDSGRAAFVDTGTTHSVPNLLKTVQHSGLGTDAVDYIFLTHIHLDHAGGAGALAQALPNAKVVVHARGAPHIIDPARLIAGTIAVYGEDYYKKAYGELVPVAADRIHVATDNERICVGAREFLLVDSPGHALHHYCMIDEANRLAFTGDSFGVSYREFDTGRGAFVFPTTTPVHFDPAQLHTTVDKIMSFAPESVYLTHYSRVTGLGRLAADMHLGIDTFVAIARRYADHEQRETMIQEAMFDWLSGRLDGHGFTGDDTTRHYLLDGDVALNTQGLGVWLARMRKTG